MIAGRMKKRLRFALTTLALAVLSGCEGLPAFKSSIPDSGVDQSAAPTVADGRSGRTGEETHELRQAIDLLQDGNLKQGRAGLVSVLKRNPANQTARSLLRQIDTDPKALLGEEYTLYTVRPGDTLGELADRLLGDAVSFLALARYNDIQRPKVLHVGQTLKIPVTQGRVAKPTAPAEQPAVEAAVEPAMAPAVVWKPTMEPDEAPTQVDADAASGESSAAPEAGAATASAADAARIAEYHQAAVVHFRNQELEEAIALWDRVLALDPGFEPAWGYRMRAQELKRRVEALEPR